MLAEKLADRLMMRVYVPLSAVVSLDKTGRLLGLCQFDTAFGGNRMCVEPGAEKLLFLTNHPEGSRVLSSEDQANLKRLAALAPGVPVRVFVCGEDIGCVEVRTDGRKLPACKTQSPMVY